MRRPRSYRHGAAASSGCTIPSVWLRWSRWRPAWAPALGLWVLLLAGCSELRLTVPADAREKLEVRCEAPSRLAYLIDGRVVFERLGSKPLPAWLCAEPRP